MMGVAPLRNRSDPWIKPWGLRPQTPAAHTCQMDDPPLNHFF